MIQIVYSSVARGHFSPSDLAQLLTKARTKNAEVGVTGLLLYQGGAFLQVLEGERPDVQSVLARIQRDARHDRLNLIQQTEIEQRSFAEWTMGFVTLDGALLKDLKGRHAFLSNGTLHGDPPELLALLEDFRNSGARRYLYG